PIGAALWKSRAGANVSGEAGPLKESVTDLEFRLAALENSGVRFSSEEREHTSSATTFAAVASLEASLASLTTRYDSRLTQLETRVGDHDAKLKEVPTLAQVVSTMEEMLSSTMSGLDNKL